MASEVVSYMIIFSLGITMVIAIGFTMINLSNSVSETTADVEMNHILVDMKEVILQEIDSFSYVGTFSYTLALNIPNLLSERYLYEITIQENNGGHRYYFQIILFLLTNFEIIDNCG